MLVGIFSMFLLACFMVAGGVPVDKGEATVVFYTPAFILTCFVFCGSIVYECWRRRQNWKRISFFISHLSLVAILLGCFIGMFFSVRSEFSMQIGSEYVYEEVPGPERKTTQNVMDRIRSNNVELGFGIAVKSFVVDHFPAEYDLFVEVEKEDRFGGKYLDYEFTKTYYTKQGDLQFDNGTVVSLESLKNSDSGKWLQQYVVEGVGIVQLAPLRDKFYEVEIRITNKDREELALEKMRINYPIKYNGWKFYLMSYDKQNQQYISITARKDPGRVLVVWGFWALMISISMLCFGANVLKGGRDEN